MFFVPILVKLDEIGDGVSLVWADFTQRLYGREGAAGNVELRRRAGEEQKSLNAVIIEALEKAIGVQSGPTEHTDLDFLIGSWEEDPMFDEVIADFEQLDEEGMWR